MEIETDSDLLKRVADGYVSAFEQLVSRYQRPLLSFLSRYVADRRDAEEIAQDAFVTVYRTVDRIDTRRKFSSYLFTVAKNAAVSRLRTAKAAKRITETDAIEDDAVLYEELARTEERERVRTVLSRLGARYSSVIDLYYFRDLSYEEIAARLGVPLNTVRTWLSRAKSAFRIDYEKNG